MPERIARSDLDAESITALSPLPSDPNLRRVVVGRRTVARLRASDVEALGLEVGAEWTTELVAEVERRASLARTRRKALTLLGRRSYTAHEMRERLQRAGHPQEHAAAVVDALCEDDWLDDGRTALDFSSALLEREPLTKPALMARLARRGIEPGVAERAAEQALEGRDPLEAAEGFARRRLATMTGIDRGRAARRIAGQLGRRGYEHDEVLAVLSRLGLATDD